MADIALAGLVQEGVPSMGGVARDLLPGAVLALDAVAAQMTPVSAGFAPLDPGHLGDFGQGASLGSRSTGHPGGHGSPGGGGDSWLSNSTHTSCLTDDALLPHHGQVAVGDHGQVAGGHVDRHAGVFYEQVLHGAGLCCGSFWKVDQHPALFISLSHTGVGSLQLGGHLLHLPKEQAAQTLEHISTKVNGSKAAGWMVGRGEVRSRE